MKFKFIFFTLFITSIFTACIEPKTLKNEYKNNNDSIINEKNKKHFDSDVKDNRNWRDLRFKKSFDWNDNKSIKLKLILKNTDGSLLRYKTVKVYDRDKRNARKLLANVTTSKNGELKISLSIKKETNRVWIFYVDKYGKEISFWHLFENTIGHIFKNILNFFLPVANASSPISVPSCRNEPGQGYPGCENNHFKIISCEDLFPYLGDSDFNDLSIKYRVEYLESGLIILRIKYLSNGANLHQSLGFHFPDYSASDVLSIDGHGDGSIISQNLNGTESGITELNLIAADTVSQFIPPYVNTKADGILHIIPEQVIKITFKPGLGPRPGSLPSSLEPTPFVVINKETGRRISYPGKSIPGYSSSYDNTGDHFTGFRSNMKNSPWCVRHYFDTVEKTDITDAWPDFATWALSGGHTSFSSSAPTSRESKGKKIVVNRDQRSDIIELVVQPPSSFTMSYSNSEIRDYGKNAVKPNINASTFTDLQVVGRDHTDINQVKITNGSEEYEATIVSKAHNVISIQTPELPGGTTYHVDLIDSTGNITRFYNGLDVDVTSSEAPSSTTPPGTKELDDCTGYAKILDLGSSSTNQLMTSTDFTSEEDVCFLRGKFTFDETLISFNFGHMKVASLARLQHQENDASVTTLKKLDFDVKSLVVHGGISPMSKGYQNKWVGGVSQARTVGNRLIATMSSAEQLTYLGKTFVDYDVPVPGGSHGGTGGVYTKQTDLSAYGYGDFRAPSYPGSPGNKNHSNGNGGGVVIIRSSGNCHLEGTSARISVKPDMNQIGASGGSIYLRCLNFSANNLSTSVPSITANGVSGYCGSKVEGSSGAGGGGRVSLIAEGTNAANDFMGDLAYPLNSTFNSFLSRVQAIGGGINPSCGGNYSNGGAGTIYLEHSGQRTGGQNLGALIIHNFKAKLSTGMSFRNAQTVLRDADVVVGTLDISNGAAVLALGNVNAVNGSILGGSSLLSFKAGALKVNGVFTNGFYDTDYSTTSSARGSIEHSYFEVDHIRTFYHAYPSTNNVANITFKSISATNTNINGGTIYSESHTGANITLNQTSSYYGKNINLTGNFTINDTAKLTHLDGAQTLNPGHILNVSIGGNLEINNSGDINLQKKGFGRKYLGAGDLSQLVNVETLSNYEYFLGHTPNDWSLNAGGYNCGGAGIYHSTATNAVKSIGNYRNPKTMGVGNNRSGKAGGVIILDVTGSCNFNTTQTAIYANGANKGGGGGSVNMTCGSFHGTTGVNMIDADGSQYLDYYSWGKKGASGGGCIKLKSTGDETTFTGAFTLPNDSSTFNSFMNAVHAYGGDGKNWSSGGRQRGHGGAGTIFIEHSGTTHGILYIVNNKADYDPRLDGTTLLPTTSINGNNVTISTPSSNSIRIPTSSAAEDFINLPNYFQNHQLKLWSSSSSEPTSSETTIYNIDSNDQNTFTLNSSPPVISSDHSYRVLHYLDDLIIRGSAQVDAETSDFIVNDCSLALSMSENMISSGSTLTRNNIETSCGSIGP